MKTLAVFSLFCIVLLVIGLIEVTTGQSANSLAKQNSKSKQTLKERYLSKSYGEVQFNKYRGQLPPKGTIIQCAFNCLSLATCHCIGINIQTSECHFYGLDESPSYDAWKLSTGSGSTGLSKLSTNSTNRDYLFFTRDIFAEDSFDKVDVAAGRKVLTSWSLEHRPTDLKKSSLKSKSKDIKKGTKPKLTGKKGAVKDKSVFPFPWIQIEFKEPMYITEILLRTTKERNNELKKFHIRIGNESIKAFYESLSSDLDEDSLPNWENATLFDRNNICFEYPTATSQGSFFATGFKKLNMIKKTIKCQPCGLVGKFLVIQSLEPCLNCKPLLLNATAAEKPGKSAKLVTTTAAPITEIIEHYPIPLASVQVFGYAIGGKGRD